MSQSHRPTLVLGLDIGTSGAKGMLIDSGGKLVRQAGAEYPLLTPRPGWTEQDSEAWWQASVTILQTLGADAPGDIVGLGLTGQMHGAVFLDGDGAVIRPAILWNDQRTAEECDDIEQILGDDLRRITGNPALTGFQAPKILWLRKHEPAHYERVRQVLLPKDYIRYRLTGDFATDASDASGTLLLGLERRDYSATICEALGVPMEWLPNVYEGPDVTGHVSVDGARQTGLSQGLPVVAGGGDNAAAAVGSGVITADKALLSVGTSGVVFSPSDALQIDPDGALHAFCHALPGTYHLMGVMLSAGGSLRWYRDTLASEEVSVASRSGADPYTLLAAQAAQVEAGSDGLYFLPYLSGERTPHMDPHARAAWIGLTLSHSRAHLLRALLEGVGYGLKDGLARMAELDVRPSELIAVGGGVRGSLWRGILATILDKPLRRVEIEEGPAYGAALLALVGSGVYASVEDAVANTVALRDDVETPDTATREVYARGYNTFRRLYPALRDAGVWG